MTTDQNFVDRIARSMDDIVLDVPQAAIVGLASMTRPTPRRRMLIFGGAPILAMALVGVMVGTGFPPPESVFASWVAIPVKADPAFASAGVNACLEESDRDASIVVQDQRGNAAALLFRTTDSLILCVIAFDSRGQVLASSSGARRLPIETHDFSLLGVGRSAAGPGSAGLTRAYGAAANGAANVLLVLDDGTRVTATVQDQWFLAWWPTDRSITSLQELAADGSVVNQIDQPETKFGL